MSTTSTRIPSATFATVVEQMQQNTGRHMLDSGGAYGRGFERKAGLTVRDFFDAPAVAWNSWGYFTLSTAHWLAARVEFHAEGNEFFRQWVALDDEATGSQSPWLVSAERFAAWVLTGDRDAEHWQGDGDGTTNTYNHESVLDETLQFVQFTVGDGYGPEGAMDTLTGPGGLVEGETYVLLQTHNGADVRGGYSTPLLYQVEGTSSGEESYAMFEEEFSIYCPNPEGNRTDMAPLDGMPEPSLHAWYFRNGEWSDSDGIFIIEPWEDTEFAGMNFGEREELPCPRCGHALDLETID